MATFNSMSVKIWLLPMCWAVGLLNLACSAADSPTSFDDGDPDLLDSDGTPDGLDTDEGQLPEGSRWGLTGTLDIVEGLIQEESSSLVLEIRSNVESCMIDASVVMSTPLDEGPEEGFSWWDLTISTQAEPPCRWPGPTTFVLGFVEPDPVLESQATPQDLRIDTTYGVVLQVEETTSLVGLAGTPEQFAGSAQRVSEGPVQNGPYTLATLYGLPL